MTFTRPSASSIDVMTSGCCRMVPGRCSIARCTTWGTELRHRTMVRRTDVAMPLLDLRVKAPGAVDWKEPPRKKDFAVFA